MLTIESFNKEDFKNSKVVVVSHNDLDCSGSILVCDKLFKDYNYLTVANGAVDKVVKFVLYGDKYKDRDVVFITDVSITSVHLAEEIKAINLSGKKRIFLFDHHDSARWLNIYDWAVVTNEPGVSASRLFFNYMDKFIKEGCSTENYKFLDKVTAIISDWDTWTWIKKDSTLPKDLATLFAKTGINYFIHKFKRSTTILTGNDGALLCDLGIKEQFILMPGILKTARNIKLWFDYKWEELIDGENELDEPTCIPHHEYLCKTVKCVSVSEAPNDLAERLYEDGIDYVAMFYSNGTVSFRSRLDDVHLGHWAKHIEGGGGHNRAAGFTLSSKTLWIYELYLHERFKEEE